MSEYRRSIAEKLYDKIVFASSKKSITFEDIRRAYNISHLGNPDLDVTEQTAQDFLDLLLYHQNLWVSLLYSRKEVTEQAEVQSPEKSLSISWTT